MMRRDRWPEQEIFISKLVNTNQGMFLVDYECTEEYFFTYFLEKFGYMPALYFYGEVSQDVYDRLESLHIETDTLIKEQ